MLRFIGGLSGIFPIRGYIRKCSRKTILFFESYADDVKCGYSTSANIAFNEGSLDGTVAPGKKMVGYYAVEVPEDTKVLTLEVDDSWLGGAATASFVLDVPAK